MFSQYVFHNEMAITGPPPDIINSADRFDCGCNSVDFPIRSVTGLLITKDRSIAVNGIY